MPEAEEIWGRRPRKPEEGVQVPTTVNDGPMVSC